MIDWKKWPEEKPEKSGWYLTATPNFQGTYEYASMYRMHYNAEDDYWGMDFGTSHTHWAEVNLPT